MGIDIKYRENPLRAVHVCGAIDNEQVYRLTPQILALRKASSDPITVYLDSPGGDIRAAENIRRMLKGPNQDGVKGPPVVTVVRNLAASAAADLLALGDYAIAYQGATIWYHGSRRAATDVTIESAVELATDLEKTNANFALRLARACIKRAVFNFGTLRSSFDECRKTPGESRAHSAITDLECFARCLASNISPPDDGIPTQALSEHVQLQLVVEYVLGVLPDDFSKLSRLRMDALVLKALLDFKLKDGKTPEWSLTDGGAKEIAQEFLRFIDYFRGEHRRDNEVMLRRFGAYLLNSEDFKDYTDTVRNEEEKGKWLEGKVGRNIGDLWYFTVSMCRLLQKGEHFLTAEEAYWLCIVDEVVGSDLPNLRMIVENDT